MGENKEKSKNEVFINQDVTVKINGKAFKFKKGKQKVSANVARILKESGYADEM